MRHARRHPQAASETGMSETFDTILKNGTVVNQDGEGQRDIGIRDGRIAALGTFGPEQAGKTIDCK
ncbi:MAG: hypothetical protein ABW151_08530, partial [Pseudorhodoplanes sp.]